MEQDFYKGCLTEKYGLTVLVPNEADSNIVHHVIYKELCLGHSHPDSKTEYIRILVACVG